MASKTEVFLFLDTLKEDGVTNMVEARPIIMETFDLPPNRAEDLLTEWMRTYSERMRHKVRG